MKTAIVINAGLGGMTLGVMQAGYHVIAACESDKKAVMIHRRNLNVPVYDEIPMERADKEWRETDLLAARLHLRPQSVVNNSRYDDADQDAVRIWELLKRCYPRTFLCFVNVSGSGKLPEYLSEMGGIGYRMEYRLIDVGKVVGFPVSERTFCVVGIRNDVDRQFNFPQDELYRIRFPKEFLQPEREVDPWYYRIREDRLPEDPGEGWFLCWNRSVYQPTDKIKWNPGYIPLVRADTAPRKITHREITNLKGFPGEYDISENNRSWLYTKLMYSENVVLVRRIAKELNHNRQINRGLQFENIFARYLEQLAFHHQNDHIEIKRDPERMDFRPDFELYYNDLVFLFELKLYHSSAAISSKVSAVCERIFVLKEECVPILVVANEIPDAVKEHCLNEYGVHIWDVGNLLWVFGEFIELKSEFIAFLDYTVDDIEAKPPIRTITAETDSEAKTKPEAERETDWGRKLSEIKAGKQYFKAYEDVCVDILKYVLGDNLTLWRKQEPSNDGLYRFDLCCKIKEGSNQDFFDTIKNYFNTKYIVFEFKNYSEKIGQKEIYTTEKYLYEKALRKVAIIISREGADEYAVKAAKGSLREEGKLILCLSDRDLLEMVELKRKEEQEPADLLEAELDDLLIHLEK